MIDDRFVLGPGTGAYVNGVFYGLSFNQDEVLSVPITQGGHDAPITLELGDIFTGYITADGDGRIWVDGTRLIDAPLKNIIRPLDDPDNPAAYLREWDLVDSPDQAYDTFYQGVTRWFGWHPADGNFYHWQSWQMRANPTAFDPSVFSKGIMFRLNADGTDTPIFEIASPIGGKPSIASDYRNWIMTADGGLWIAYFPPGTTVPDPGGGVTEWLIRRYDISDGSFQEFTPDPIARGSFDIWPLPGTTDSIFYSAYNDYTSHNVQTWWSINSSGTISPGAIGPCIPTGNVVEMHDGWSLDAPPPYMSDGTGTDVDPVFWGWAENPYEDTGIDISIYNVNNTPSLLWRQSVMFPPSGTPWTACLYVPDATYLHFELFDSIDGTGLIDEIDGEGPGPLVWTFTPSDDYVFLMASMDIPETVSAIEGSNIIYRVSRGTEDLESHPELAFIYMMVRDPLLETSFAWGWTSWGILISAWSFEGLVIPRGKGESTKHDRRVVRYPKTGPRGGVS